MKMKIYKNILASILSVCLLLPPNAFGAENGTEKPRSNTLQPASRFNRLAPRIIPIGSQYVITEERIKDGSRPVSDDFQDDISFYYISMLIGDALTFNIGELALRDLIKRNLKHIDFKRFDLDGMLKDRASFTIPYRSAVKNANIVVKYSLPVDGQEISSSAIEMETSGGTKFMVEMLQERDLNRPAPGDISEEEGQRLIREGFDYDDKNQLELVFEAVKASGFNVRWPEFKQKMKGLKKFDSQYPGYFNSLFVKDKRLRPFEINSTGIREIDPSSVDRKVLAKTFREMLEAKDRFDSLAWIVKDFSGDKVVTVNNIYSGMMKEKSEKERKDYIPQAFVTEAIMRDAIADPVNARFLYRAVFNIAHSRFMEHDRGLRDKYADLAVSAIIADALTDRALVEGLASDDVDIQAVAFKNLFTNYVDHIPINTGMKGARSDKLLAARLDKLSGDALKALAAVSAVVKKDKDTIRFAPAGFLSVFRGRAGISDCSFDEDMSSPYARAMHEDTLYYLVYKGGELKGYVGMCVGKALSGKAGGKNILTIDTINSPVLDGEELLMNILARLWKESQYMGLAGIALPSRQMNIAALSFNFENVKTLKKMSIYTDAARVKVKPVHDGTWRWFDEVYEGHDVFNSIEYGEVVLLKDDELKAIADKNDAPSSTTVVMEVARQSDIGTLLADDLKLVAHSAKKEEKTIIVAIETNGWVPEEQKGLIQSLMAEIDGLEKKLKNLGLDNVSIVRGTGDELAASINKEKIARGVAAKDVVVLASINTINSEAFAYFRSAGLEDGPFLATIDPVNLKGANYVRLLEMLLITLKLASGVAVSPQDHPQIAIESSGRRMIRLIPKAEPMDYDLLKNIYESQKKALASA